MCCSHCRFGLWLLYRFLQYGCIVTPSSLISAWHLPATLRRSLASAIEFASANKASNCLLFQANSFHASPERYANPQTWVANGLWFQFVELNGYLVQSLRNVEKGTIVIFTLKPASRSCAATESVVFFCQSSSTE